MGGKGEEIGVTSLLLIFVFHRHFCAWFLIFNLGNCLIQILDQKCDATYICFIKHGNSWKRTRPFLAVRINLSVMNRISQQFVLCVSCITCCRLAVMSHLLQLPRLGKAMSLHSLFPGETCTQSSGKSGHCCARNRTDLHLSSSCREYMLS